MAARNQHQPAIEAAPKKTDATAGPSVASASTVRRGTTSAQGLTQTFGLDIRAAVLVVLVDLMVFGGEIASMGLLIWVEVVAGVVVGFIVYLIQRHWYGDDRMSALIKSLIVGLLTAIPAPLTPFFAIPSGVLGLIQRSRQRCGNQSVLTRR